MAHIDLNIHDHHGARNLEDDEGLAVGDSTAAGPSVDATPARREGSTVAALSAKFQMLLESVEKKMDALRSDISSLRIE